MPAIRKKLEGQIFGNLTVISWDSKKYKWICYCSCGGISYPSSTDLTRLDGKASKSCKLCRAKKATNRAINRTGFNGAVNKLFYTYNCLTCCAICNFAKSSMTYIEFINWIKRLVNYNKDLLNAR